jgi:hypothetical protein
MFKNFFTAVAAMLGASAVFAQAAPAVIVLALFGIIAEHNGSRGWAVFWALVAAAIAYFAFHVSLVTLLLGAAAYIVIGLFWSFWRYKRHASKIVEKYRTANATEKEHALRNLHPKEMLGTITAWIMIWPFSMIENVIGDLITGIQMLVTKFFRGVYHKVYDSAVAALR